MTSKALLAGFAAIGLIVTPAMAAKKSPPQPPCVKDKVLTALQMRMLQTELVVGALSCKMTPRYNEFVTTYKADLMTAHRTLMKYFGRESRLEDYKSKTANEVSQRSLANITEFCNYTGALYDKLLGSERPKFTAFVVDEPSANRHGMNVCSAPSVITASSKSVPRPRSKPDVQTVSQPATASALAPRAKPVEASAAAAPATTP